MREIMDRMDRSEGRNTTMMDRPTENPGAIAKVNPLARECEEETTGHESDKPHHGFLTIFSRISIYTFVIVK